MVAAFAGSVQASEESAERASDSSDKKKKEDEKNKKLYESYIKARKAQYVLVSFKDKVLTAMHLDGAPYGSDQPVIGYIGDNEEYVKASITIGKAKPLKDAFGDLSSGKPKFYSPGELQEKVGEHKIINVWGADGTEISWEDFKNIKEPIKGNRSLAQRIFATLWGDRGTLARVSIVAVVMAAFLGIVYMLYEKYGKQQAAAEMGNEEEGAAEVIE